MNIPPDPRKHVLTPSGQVWSIDFRNDNVVKYLTEMIFDHGGWIIIRDATSLKDERIASIDSGFYTDNWVRYHPLTSQNKADKPT